MSPSQSLTLTISAGEECTISGSGVVRVQLLSGVVEVAGVPLRAKETLTFPLSPPGRCVVLYTLEGGAVLASAETPLETHRTAAGAAPVVQLCRRTLCAEPRGLTILVVGDAGVGKSLCAHTLCHALRSAESAAPVVLLDLNPASNAVGPPGCVSAAVLEAPVRAGGADACGRVGFSLFTGRAAPPDARGVAAFMHFASQLRDCAAALPGSGALCRLVVDAPSPRADVPAAVFFRRLAEAMGATHVWAVGAADEWRALREDLERTRPDCVFGAVPCVARRGGWGEAARREYFTGSVEFPLGCAKAVLPAAQLQFVRYAAHGEEVKCTRVVPTAALAGCVCALSHAVLMEEVPLAPIAGMLLIVDVDEEHEEVVAILPAAGDTLPRRFIILPDDTEEATMRVDGELAYIEEAVVA